MQSNLTSKGQVTIPKAMREHLGLAAGTPVRFSYTADGAIEILPVRGETARAEKPANPYNKLKGINRKGWASQGLKSTDEIMAWLRGYDEDRRDPGFNPKAARASGKNDSRRQLRADRPGLPGAHARHQPISLLLSQARIDIPINQFQFGPPLYLTIDARAQDRRRQSTAATPH